MESKYNNEIERINNNFESFKYEIINQLKLNL